MSRRTLILGFFAVLFVLHQDFWWRDDPRLVFGILPVSLAYHVVWTLLVAVGWFLVARFCWPAEVDETTTAADPLWQGHPAGERHRPRTHQEPLNSHHTGETPVPRPNRRQTKMQPPLTRGRHDPRTPPEQSERPER